MSRGWHCHPFINMSMSDRGTYKHIEKIASKKKSVRDALNAYLGGTESDIDKMPISGWIKDILKRRLKITSDRKGCELLDLEDYVRLMNERTKQEPREHYLGYTCRDIEVGRLSVTLTSGTPVLIINNRRIKAPYGSIKLGDNELPSIIEFIDIKGKIYPSKFPHVVQDYYNGIFGEELESAPCSTNTSHDYDYNSIYSRSVRIQR